MPQPEGKRISISKHAMQRLKERVTTYTGYRSWEHLARIARYEGKSLETMSDKEYEWCLNHLSNLHNSLRVRILNGYAFLFMGNHGHARTLVTVIQMAT